MRIASAIKQIRSHVNFENKLREARAKKVRFYFVTLKLRGSTCYVSWAILIEDLVDVKTLLLLKNQKPLGAILFLPRKEAETKQFDDNSI